MDLRCELMITLAALAIYYPLKGRTPCRQNLTMSGGGPRARIGSSEADLLNVKRVDSYLIMQEQLIHSVVRLTAAWEQLAPQEDRE